MRAVSEFNANAGSGSEKKSDPQKKNIYIEAAPLRTVQVTVEDTGSEAKQLLTSAE
jgi:hypothetical protein